MRSRTMNLGEGFELLQKGDINGAIEAFVKDIEKQPDNFDLPMMLAAVLMQANRFQSALNVLSSVAAKDPNHNWIEADQLDDYSAQCLIEWAHQIEKEGFQARAIDEFVSAANVYASSGFHFYLSEVMAVEAAIRNRQPVLIEYESKFSDETYVDDEE